MKDLVIIGAGGFGRELKTMIDYINEQEPTWNVLGYIDDNLTSVPEGYKILGNMDTLFNMSEKPYVTIPIADWKARRAIAKKCMDNDIPIATIIHPNLRINKNVTIGKGCIIMRDCLIATNAHIGDFVILNVGCTFGHDTIVKDYVSMMSFGCIAGEVVIGENCYFGLRTTVINRLEICDNCTIGACACVVKDVKEPGTYVGIPAKMIKPYIG